MNFWVILPALPVASLWVAYVQSNFMGRSIVLIQIVMSIVVWSIMVGKWQELRMMYLVARRFRKVFDNTHDVLEIIHCPVSKPVEDLTLVLAELISENAFDPVEVYGMSKQDLILVLVNNYGWEYTHACNFAENYW